MTTARILTVSAFYPREPDRVFAEAIDIPAMIRATRGLATYQGLPEGAFEEGQSYQAYITVWGWMHNPRYRIHVERLNPATREMQSREQGRAIRQWDHTLSVTPTEGGAIWQDRIIVDSGLLTGYMVRVGRHMYKYRHRMRDAARITATIDRA
jgi:hypothetical protein